MPKCTPHVCCLKLPRRKTPSHVLVLKFVFLSQMNNYAHAWNPGNS